MQKINKGCSITIEKAVGDGSTRNVGLVAVLVSAERTAFFVGRRLEGSQKLLVVARPQVAAVVLEVVGQAVVQLKMKQFQHLNKMVTFAKFKLWREVYMPGGLDSQSQSRLS
jgi:hypothetical protein